MSSREYRRYRYRKSDGYIYRERERVSPRECVRVPLGAYDSGSSISALRKGALAKGPKHRGLGGWAKFVNLGPRGPEGHESQAFLGPAALSFRNSTL